MHWSNAGSVLGYRLWRWANVKTALGQCIVVSWIITVGGGGGPKVLVSIAAFHARVRGSFRGLGGLKEAKMFLLHPLVNSVLWRASVTET